MNSGVENSDNPVEDRADALKVKAVLKVQIDQYMVKQKCIIVLLCHSCPVHISSLVSGLYFIALQGFGHFFIRNQGGFFRWYSVTFKVFGNAKQADLSDYMHLHIKISDNENIIYLWMYKEGLKP